MTGALILQILAAVGGLAGFSAIINLLISRKKIAAESDDIVQNTTDRVIKNLNDDNSTLRNEVKQIKDEAAALRVQTTTLYDLIANMEREEMVTRQFLLRLINWSRNAYEQILEHGLKIDQPPSMETIQRIVNKDSG